MQWFSRLDQVNGPVEPTPPLPEAADLPAEQDQGDGECQPDRPLESDSMVPAPTASDEPRLMDDAPDEIAPVASTVVDVSQFEAIFTRFQTPISNYLYRLVGNREQAFDLAQDVFVKAYRALVGGTTIQSGALSSWMYRIASNTATDALRRRKLITWLPLSLFNDDRGIGAGLPGEGDEPVSGGQSVGAGLGYDGGRFEQHVAEREAVQHVLGQLPTKYAACLLLYEYEGFSCAEIAQMLEISPSAVKMRLMRAREKFITLYKQEVSGL